MSLKEAAEKAYTMTGFINKLHRLVFFLIMISLFLIFLLISLRCGDILMNRRIKMLSEEEEDTLALTYAAGDHDPAPELLPSFTPAPPKS